MNETASFGYWVRRRRKALDLTQDELAQQVGCAVVTIQKIETDERRPSKPMAELLADCLKIAPAERAAFVQSARGERSVTRLPLAQQPIAPESINPSSSNLPAQPNPFVGRQQALSEVKRLLGQTRLLTITGVGGTGKTRLAVQVAHELYAHPAKDAHFSDGICFCSLAVLHEPELVAQGIIDALGVKAASQTDPADVLKRHLREKQMLLVLDNFEHLMAATSLVSELLSAAPRLKILTTSREPLQVYGEQEYRLPPMALPSVHRPELWPALTQVDSVALFIQRAQASKPDFQLTADNAMTIAEICMRLDGLPLAIELAAVRIKLFTLQNLLQRLSARLPLLTTGARDWPRRQQTLRATIDWSYELLSADERRLFAQLAVFAHGFTLDAVEAICADPFQFDNLDSHTLSAQAEARPNTDSAVLDLLTSLVNKSLVQQHDDAEGEARFGILETIREYALERMQALPHVNLLRRRHLAYYARLAEASEAHILGASQALWLNRLAREHDNLRAGLQWSLSAENETDGALGLRLVAVLGWFWHLRGYWREGRQWVTQFLARTMRVGPAEAYAKVLCSAGLMAWAQNDYAEAKSFLEQGLAHNTAAMPTSVRAHTLGVLGVVWMYELQPEAARPLFDESLRLFRALEDPFGLGATWVRLGICARLQGEWREAIRATEEALVLYRELNNAWGEAIALACLGEVALMQNDWQRAARCYAEVVPKMQATGSQWYTALSLVGVAGVASARGYLPEAARLLGVVDGLLAAVGGHIPPVDRLLYDEVTTTVRASLGEVVYNTAHTEGQRAPQTLWEAWSAEVLGTHTED